MKSFRIIILLFFVCVSFYSCSTKTKETVQQLPNILFIPVDDLRPELGCYGNEFIKTPNIDRLASQGVAFTRTYCQQAVCSASRASLLTGLRPDSIEVWDLQSEFRTAVPGAVTLPQFFKKNGYTSIGLGKTFHNIFPDTISWTEKPHVDGFPFDPDAFYVNDDNLKIQQEKIDKLKAAGKSTIDQLGHWYVKAKATEIGTKGDDAYFDGAQTTLAIKKMQELAESGNPFFLSVGYYRPHLPFNAPKKYWDMYDRDSIPLAENQFTPEGSPEYANHGYQELKSYIDCRDLPRPMEQPWGMERQKELKHGYYASVSYMDAQVGRLLDELERLGLSENTIVVLWGDHGWKLGEHNGWCKMSNYEIDTHVPLIVSGAGVKAKGQKSNALTEFVDIYPTLCEMTGFPVPDQLQGTSFVPLLENPNKEWKTAAFSQYLLGRFGPAETRKQERMGYTIRTNHFRYVEWYSWNKEEKKKGELLDRELFDHQIDPLENKNLVNNHEYKNTVESLSRQLKLGWQHALPKTNK